MWMVSLKPPPKKARGATQFNGAISVFGSGVVVCAKHLQARCTQRFLSESTVDMCLETKPPQPESHDVNLAIAGDKVHHGA